jgi:hypothetical protein
MVRSGQPTGALIPVVYLFGGEESKAKNSKVADEYAEHREHGEFILVRASGEYYPMSSCRCRFLGDCVMVGGLQRVASSALYWPADEVGSPTPGRLRPGDLSLSYTYCHIPSICFRRHPPRSLSCTPSLEVVIDQVIWGIFWKVFRRSCGPPTRWVGSINRSAGLLVGRTHLPGMAVSLVSGDPGVPMSHKPPSVRRSDLRKVMTKS